MNRDLLNAVPPRAAMAVAYDVLDTISSHPPHCAVAAVSILLQELSAFLRIPVSELLNKADRITHDLNEHYMPEIKAMREFITHEMRT